MVSVEKVYKGSWFEHDQCKSMREAKRKAEELSKTHKGEVKAEKTDRNGYNIETHYYENGVNTNSYNW